MATPNEVHKQQLYVANENLLAQMFTPAQAPVAEEHAAPK